MLLFSREVRLNGSRPREAIAHSVQLAEYVTQTNGVPVELWAQVYSPAADSIVYTAFLPDMTALEAAMDKLMVDDQYHAMVEQAQQFLIPGSLVDGLLTVVYPSEMPTEDRPSSYARVIQSTAVVSRIADAVALGVELAARAEEVTGTPVLFGINETGPFIGVEWIYVYADAAEAEAANLQIGTDDKVMELIGRTPDLFIAGGSTRTLYRKLG